MKASPKVDNIDPLAKRNPHKRGLKDTITHSWDITDVEALTSQKEILIKED